MNLEAGLEYFFALCVVLGLMVILAMVLKKLNTMQSGLSGKSNRLSIVEQRMIDTKTKAVIIRCDNKDHLVIVGPHGTSTVKNDIPLPKETPKNKKDIPVESV